MSPPGASQATLPGLPRSPASTSPVAFAKRDRVVQILLQYVALVFSRCYFQKKGNRAMPGRYQEQPSNLFPVVSLRLFSALKEKLKEGYSLSDFKSDLMSGIVVAMVAIPLGMALAIASGVAPQYGLYTVIIGGGVVALLGGSRFQVTGPTAAFVVILAPIAQKFGFPGLLVAGMIAGFMLMLMGLARMGRLIQFIPYPVTTGFTSGIAIVIATLQVKDFFGLHVDEMPERYLEKVLVLFRARSSVS